VSDQVTTLEPEHPVWKGFDESRKSSLQDRIADRITAFSGSMPFIYIHIVWFALWIGLRVEKFPFGLLTMLVSLEAIFLSTFVLISQNRADARKQVLANHEWQVVQQEEAQNKDLLRLSSEADQQNRQLLELSNQILALTKAIHEMTAARGAAT
jgi:uncharacterized membrane protein